MRMWDQVVEHRMRFLKTWCFYCCYITMGLLTALVGPTLLDLKLQVQEQDLRTVSLTITTRAAGTAIGAFISK